MKKLVLSIVIAAALVAIGALIPFGFVAAGEPTFVERPGEAIIDGRAMIQASEPPIEILVGGQVPPSFVQSALPDTRPSEPTKPSFDLKQLVGNWNGDLIWVNGGRTRAILNMKEDGSYEAYGASRSDGSLEVVDGRLRFRSTHLTGSVEFSEERSRQHLVFRPDDTTFVLRIEYSRKKK